MAKRTPRVRCLVCGELVLRRFDPDDPETSYAVIPLRIKEKRGCVCADCVEFYSEREPYGAYFGPEESDSSSEPSSAQLLLTLLAHHPITTQIRPLVKALLSPM